MSTRNRLIMGSAIGLGALAVTLDHTCHRLPTAGDPGPAAHVAPDAIGGDGVGPCALGGEFANPCSLGVEPTNPCSLGDTPTNPCSLGEHPVNPCSL